MQKLKKRYRMDKEAKREYKKLLREVLAKDYAARKIVVEALPKKTKPPEAPNVKELIGFSENNDIIGRIEFLSGNNRRFRPDYFSRRAAKRELRRGGARSFCINSIDTHQPHEMSAYAS